MRKPSMMNKNRKLFARAKMVNIRNINAVAEYILDFYFCGVSRPVMKTEFVSKTTCLFLGGWQRSSQGVLAAKSTISAFDLLVDCGALRYTPGKHILPGENE